MNRFYNRFGDSRGGYNNDEQEGFYEDEFPWDNQGPQNFMPPVGPMFRNNNRRARYNEAYGDYRGGYGPGGGFGPRPLFMPPPPMPCPPPPRMPVWGRGFGPQGPPRRNNDDDRAIKYLMRCGLTKEHLKNLPHDLLRLIQPEYCGLCDFSFDSFTMSRMHYISKNHLKNQKKWLAKSQGAFESVEMPMKARNLYCELCDIQITSKSHGDAHYDGKPHRGIVEGRKKPKNPLLLQSFMQKRVEQLIRREKRVLKPIKDTAEENGDDFKELKTALPELYCDICKTTVTCSEQMTMHMNGKKHLSKEKQHILKMMKGDVADDNKASKDDEEANEDNAEEDEGADVDETKAEEDEDNAAGDDWGDEAWDNQDQTQETAEA